MAIRCLFFTPGQTPPCEVLRATSSGALQARTLEELSRRYCECGSFIACPIFQRVEKSLIAADDRRRQAARPPAELRQ